ncbi:MAG: hypothetical protein WDM96_14165 [Lacunisphaera sp.]
MSFTRRAEGNLRGVVGAGAPDVIVRHERAEDGAALGAGAMVADLDVGQTDALADAGLRTGLREVDLGSGGLGERSGAETQAAKGEESRAKE